MEVFKVQNLPPPPGVISSIKAGFDRIATNLGAVVLPLLLNLFLWLGPRLKMSDLFASIQAEMVQAWKAGGFSADDVQKALDLYNSVIPRLNLFWLLHTAPVGVSSLFFPGLKGTPLGTPAVLQVTDLNLLGWMFLLSLAGWIGGGLYYHSVAAIALADGRRLSLLRALGQTVLLSLLWGFLLFAAGIPVFLVIAFAAQVSALVANVLLIGLSLLSMWIIVPLFFWPHGIFVAERNVIASIQGSFRMTRFSLPASSMFVLTAFLLTFGLNYLWSIPPEESWMTLVGILGHSFVTTAVLAASFIYYRDMNAWIALVTDRLKSGDAPLGGMNG